MSKLIKPVERMSQEELYIALCVINRYKAGDEGHIVKTGLRAGINTIGILIDAYRRACEAAEWSDERADHELLPTKITNMHDYPCIFKLAISIATSNGIINRLEPVGNVIDKTGQAIGADGVYVEDVRELERWLSTLSAEQLEILSDGEDEETMELMDTSPMTKIGSNHVADLIGDIYYSISEAPWDGPKRDK